MFKGLSDSMPVLFRLFRIRLVCLFSADLSRKSDEALPKSRRLIFVAVSVLDAYILRQVCMWQSVLPELFEAVLSVP
jgi:hypothetical protein